MKIDLNKIRNFFNKIFCNQFIVLLYNLIIIGVITFLIIKTGRPYPLWLLLMNRSYRETTTKVGNMSTAVEEIK